MKINAMSLLGFTTLLLITVTIFATMNMSFGLVFFVTVLGQGLLVYTVYRILKDDYTTNKTFEDFYEDRPDLGKDYR
jgi:hypothetical protein